jgi:hypothetical protein
VEAEEAVDNTFDLECLQSEEGVDMKVAVFECFPPFLL